MNNFLPKNYEIPKTPSKYTKFENDKTTRIRILPSWTDKDTIIFYEYFDISGENPKPVRSIKPFQETPWIKEGQKQKEIWNCKVWNYEIEQVQICSIWQMTIKEAIMNYYMDNDFWSPVLFDLKISKKWEKLETTYWVIASPPKEFDKSLLVWKDFKIDWSGFLKCETDIFQKV
jgi:hypothetical protein